ncbi:RNA polymerase sigma factor [Actinoplanes derwentensis]|uniref:RNA polymerase sigma-70 factor, ECF subfamily n=1 Tax=Actinoplanes derwentensis TaxID=113562 RepID=A0A1H2CGW9_9ACTN|nr:SigE family RNA polymerase sigma factor [Actinoplanes derwentensis]GID88720.1 RNA polymerase sigma24 factor [Actinoplanes derwentensis]SDT69775.1 RNA polymerase sigma-70 factor, ECF subfamily [Actinoplanes derwentensis]
MAGRDSADFDSFYIATVRRVVLYLYAAGGDRAEAQDIAQEAYARAWQHWGRVAGYEDPEAWVRQVAWRLMLNRWRSLRRWVAARARLEPSETVGGPSPDRVAVIGALQRLPSAQRQVVALYYLLDVPVQEIAATVGVPVGTVKARLSRARTALGRLLDDQEMSRA